MLFNHIVHITQAGALVLFLLDRIKWRGILQKTYTLEPGDLDENGWMYITIVYAENGSTSATTTGGSTLYINNKYICHAKNDGGANINKPNYLFGKYQFQGHGYSGNQPSGDLASVVIMNKPLEDINDYKLVHEYNKGNLGNHLDGTYVAPPPKYTSTEDRPAATEHIVHYFDGTINATTGDLIDHIGDAVGVLMGTQETGTSEYGFTVKCSNSFYKILYRKYTPVYTNKVTISFYYKTSASGPSTGCTLVGH